MRTFFVLLLISWLIGTGLGAGRASWLVINPIAVLISALLWRKLNVPLAVAGLGLLLIGSLYGNVALSNVTQNCRLENPALLTITERPDVRPTMVRYVVVNEHDCYLLVTTPRFPVYAEGSTLRVSRGTLQAIIDFPEELKGYGDYLTRRGIAATWRYPTIEVVTTKTMPTSSYAHVQARINALFREPEAGLIAALLIGDTGNLSTTIQDTFRATGVSHIISISGLHISFIAGVLVALFLLLPVRPVVRTILVIGLLYTYVLFIGAPVAALRALLFWTVVLLGLRLRALVSLPTMLLIATTIVITQAPLLIFDISFQLSFSAVAGIFLALFLWQRSVRTLPTVLQPLTSLLLVSAGATLTTWPLVAYHFNTVSVVSPLANLFIVPLSTAILLVGAITLFVSYFIPLAAGLGAYGVHLLVTVTIAVTELLARVPFASLEEISLPAWLIGSYYGLVALMSILWLKYQHRSWREIWQ